VKFNLKTPGREDDEDVEDEGGETSTTTGNKFSGLASKIYEGLGGDANLICSG
jgi:N-acetylglucosamine PTS system EIICBA or EIICB component